MGTLSQRRIGRAPRAEQCLPDPSAEDIGWYRLLVQQTGCSQSPCPYVNVRCYAHFAWLAASRISGSHILFPAFEKRGTVVTARPMDRNDVLRMVKRRLLSAGIPSVFSNHSFRATGITEFLANGGSLETAQELANHADRRTTRLYDRRATRMEMEETVRIRY